MLCLCAWQECDEKLRHDYFEARVVPLKVAAAKEAEAKKASLEADFRFLTRLTTRTFLPAAFALPLIGMLTPPILAGHQGFAVLSRIHQKCKDLQPAGFQQPRGEAGMPVVNVLVSEKLGNQGQVMLMQR